MHFFIATHRTRSCRYIVSHTHIHPACLACVVTCCRPLNTKDLQQLRVVWRTQTRNWIPTLSNWKSRSTSVVWSPTDHAIVVVAANGDIVEGSWVLVQGWVDKSNRSLACLETLVVDTGQQRSEDWRRSAGTANESRCALVEDDNVVADG